MSTSESLADAPSRSPEKGQARGWAVFAAVMLLIIGLDAFWGAVLNNEVVVVGATA